MTCDDQSRLALGRNAYNPAAAGERRRDIEIARCIKGKPLRPAQAAIKNAHVAMRIDAVNRVEARRSGTGYIEMVIGAEGKVIRRDARLKRGVHKDLAVAPDLEDGSAAVADVKVLFAVEGNSGCDAHAFGVDAHRAVGRNPIYRSV